VVSSTEEKITSSAIPTRRLVINGRRRDILGKNSRTRTQIPDFTHPRKDRFNETFHWLDLISYRSTNFVLCSMNLVVITLSIGGSFDFYLTAQKYMRIETWFEKGSRRLMYYGS